jgi:hypothetical protein
VVRTQAQQRQRQPDLVVLVALVPERRHRRPEDRRDGLLRRRLGDRAGDPDDERIEPGAPLRGDRPERGERGGDRPQRSAPSYGGGDMGRGAGAGGAANRVDDFPDDDIPF